MSASVCLFIYPPSPPFFCVCFPPLLFSQFSCYTQYQRLGLLLKQIKFCWHCGLGRFLYRPKLRNFALNKLDNEYKSGFRDAKTYQRANNVGVKNPIWGKIFAKFHAVLSGK